MCNLVNLQVLHCERKKNSFNNEVESRCKPRFFSMLLEISRVPRSLKPLPFDG